MQVLIVSGILIALAISLFLSSSIHQGLSQRTYPNPPHSTFDHEKISYTKLERLIQKKHKNIACPEAIAIASNGDMYTAVRNGQVIRIAASNGEKSLIAHLPGRGVGLTLTHDERGLYVAVAVVGLVHINLSTHTVEIVSTISSDGLPIRFADDVTIGNDGKVYFSDATRVSPWVDQSGDFNLMFPSLLDALLGSGTGRLLVYDPTQRSTETVIGNLLFANGVIMAPDFRFVLVCETFGYRVTRVWLDGPRKGTVDYFTTGLPGFPDNINRAADGGYWVAINAEASPLFDLLVGTPGLRTLVSYINLGLLPTKRFGGIIKLNSNGVVIDTLLDANGVSTAALTSVKEFRNGLYLGSLGNNFIGYVDLAALSRQRESA